MTSEKGNLSPLAREIKTALSWVPLPPMKRKEMLGRLLLLEQQLDAANTLKEKVRAAVIELEMFRSDNPRAGSGSTLMALANFVEAIQEALDG